MLRPRSDNITLRLRSDAAPLLLQTSHSTRTDLSSWCSRSKGTDPEINSLKLRSGITIFLKVQLRNRLSVCAAALMRSCNFVYSCASRPHQDDLVRAPFTQLLTVCAVNISPGVCTVLLPASGGSPASFSGDFPPSRLLRSIGGARLLRLGLSVQIKAYANMFDLF